MRSSEAVIALLLVALWTGVAVMMRPPAKVSPLVQRVAFACAAAATAATLAWIFWSVPRAFPSDLTPVWAAAGALFRGHDPYQTVGPARAFEWPFPLLYPLTAVLAIAPLAALPLRAADLAFVFLGFGLFAWAISNHRQLTPAHVALISLPALMTLQTSQWSVLLTGAALVPPLGFLLVAKPTVGLALFAAFPTWRTAAGCALLVIASLVISPGWVAEWRASFATVPHVVAPITRIGGPLALLAILRWKRADARLLLALACIPHTTALYETIPLFLIPNTWRQAWTLWTLAVLAYAGQWATGPYDSVQAHWTSGAQWIVALMYLPCVAMVLMRPNVWSDVDARDATRPATAVRPPAAADATAVAAVPAA
jgi:hypothetical protein